MNLQIFARRIARNQWLRHLLFLAAAALSILIIGYHFGTFDQIIHIPFLKAAVDPTLYPGDEFIALRHSQYSFFWRAFYPFYRWGLLEAAMFATHFLATYLTFTAFWSLSHTLFGDPLAALIGVVAFIFPHFGFLGFPVIEFSLLNRTFVLPFLLIAINLFLHRRYRMAFLLLGVMANLHALTVMFVAAMLVFAGLVEIRRIGFLKFGQAMGLFLIAGLPVLLMKADNTNPADWSLRPEWVSIIVRSSLAHVLTPFSLVPYVPLLTIGGFSALGLYLIARRASPSPRHEKTVALLLVAAFLIFAAGAFAVVALPVTILVEAQATRAILYLPIFAYLYFANYLAKEYRARRLDRAGFVFIAGIFCTSLSPLLPLAAWGLLRWLKPGQLKLKWAIAAVAGGCGIFLVAAASVGFWNPGIHFGFPKTDWVDVQRWASQNTPKDAVFIAPPEKGGPFEPEWRVYSERSNIASLLDPMEIALVPQYLDTWVERFNTIAPGALEQFNGNFFDSLRFTRQAYYGLTDQALLQMACTYQAEYLVVEKPHRRDFPVSYENPNFIVYSLQSSRPCATTGVSR